MSNNGGSSTTEPRLLELVPIETSLFLSKREELTGNTTLMQVLFTDTLDICSKRSDGSIETEELSRIFLEDAFMLAETLTHTTDTLYGPNVTITKVKVG